MIKSQQSGKDYGTINRMKSMLNNKLWIPINNFSLNEFKCKCGCNSVMISEQHIMRLQIFRDFLSKKYKKDVPLKINSGYRCIKHNSDIGGVANSQHTKGLASDICSPVIDAEQIYNGSLECKIFSVSIFYPDKHFVHLDSRINDGFKYWIQTG